MREIYHYLIFSGQGVELEAFCQELEAEGLDFEEDQVLEAEELGGEIPMVVVMGGAEDGVAPQQLGGEVVDERLVRVLGGGVE